METVLASPGRVRACEEADQRYQRYCGACPFKAHCPGHFVVDATPEQRRLLAHSGCPLRAGIEHVLKRADQTGLAGLLTKRPAADERSGALAVPL